MYGTVLTGERQDLMRKKKICVNLRDNFRTDTKRSKELIPKRLQRGLIKKSQILLSQYWKNESLDGTIIISYFGGSNNILADCTL